MEKKIMKRAVLTVITVLLSCSLFAAETAVKPRIDSGTAWYNTRGWAPGGQCWKVESERYFTRLPERMKKDVTPAVWGNAQNSAGLFFRFDTDAAFVKVKYKLSSSSLSMTHMPATGKSGLDLYAKKNGKWIWAGNTRPVKQEDTAVLINGLSNKSREFMLYLPLYNGITELEIGVPEKTTFKAITPDNTKWIAYYGTSIAHGGCASRPGLAFTAMLGRRLDIPVANLGFSGSAKMELPLAGFFAELKPSLFVLDPLWNMNADLVKERAIAFIQKIRQTNPTLPILLVEDSLSSSLGIRTDGEIQPSTKQNYYREAFDHFKKAGDKNIYYLPYNNLLREDLDWDGTVDSCHMNDLGMFRMTDALEKTIRPILEKKQ